MAQPSLMPLYASLIHLCTRWLRPEDDLRFPIGMMYPFRTRGAMRGVTVFSGSLVRSATSSAIKPPGDFQKASNTMRSIRVALMLDAASCEVSGSSFRANPYVISTPSNLGRGWGTEACGRTGEG
jgi:hypothetical protein